MRLCPVPRGRGVLVDSKKCHGVLRRSGALATLRLLARQSSFPVASRQTSGLPAEVGLIGESETSIRASLLLAKQATRRRFGRWLGMARFGGYWPRVFPDDLLKRRPLTTQPTTSTRAFKTRGLIARAIVSIPLAIPHSRSPPLSGQSAFTIAECAAVFNRSLCAILGKVAGG